MVSPSPTVSMLRSMRSSKCSFLLRESRAKEVTSPGAGRTTSPPHSTFKRNDEYFTCTEHLCTSVSAASTDVIDGDDAALPDQLQGLLVVEVIVGFIGINEHKVVGSGLACCYQLILGTKETNSFPKSNFNAEIKVPTQCLRRQLMFDLDFRFNSSLCRKDWTDFCCCVCFTQVLRSWQLFWYLRDLSQFLVYSFWKVVFVVKGNVPEPLLVKRVLSPLWKMVWRCWCTPPLSRRLPPFRSGASPGPCSGRCSQCTSLQWRHGRSAASHNYSLQGTIPTTRWQNSVLTLASCRVENVDTVPCVALLNFKSKIV